MGGLVRGGRLRRLHARRGLVLLAPSDRHRGILPGQPQPGFFRHRNIALRHFVEHDFLSGRSRGAGQARTGHRGLGNVGNTSHRRVLRVLPPARFHEAAHHQRLRAPGGPSGNRGPDHGSGDLHPDAPGLDGSAHLPGGQGGGGHGGLARVGDAHGGDGGRGDRGALHRPGGAAGRRDHGRHSVRHPLRRRSGHDGDSHHGHRSRGLGPDLMGAPLGRDSRLRTGTRPFE